MPSSARAPPRLITVQALADAARVAPLTMTNVIDYHSARDARAVAAALAIAYRGRALGRAQTQRLACTKRRRPRDDRILEEAMATVG